MTDDRLRVRIDASEKAAAMERAAEQDTTLSEAIRLLLALWCDGHIDVQELQAMANLPGKGELQSLGANLDALAQAIESAHEGLRKFERRHGQAMDMGASVALRSLPWYR